MIREIHRYLVSSLGGLESSHQGKHGQSNHRPSLNRRRESGTKLSFDCYRYARILNRILLLVYPIWSSY
jgi:hypothetical protein